MTLFADLLATVFERRHRTDPVPHGAQRPVEDMIADLMGTAGEVSGQSLARGILDAYADMDDDGKLALFGHMARALDISADRVRRALEAYQGAPSKSSYRQFMAAAEPPRQELIRRLNGVPGATQRLVAMRADLLRLARGDDALQALDLDFRHLFASWFNRGFLVLRPISWDSPANVLEKIIAYEAVHAIDSWDDLRRRLQPPDRRCFAFFHPAMPSEPLIFVEVALTQGVPGSIQDVLAENRAPMAAAQANTAVFYSISNCQAGLANISFGNLLIKQVATDLAAELSGLSTFVTLSPIPLMRSWLDDTGWSVDFDSDAAVETAAATYLLTAKRPDGLPVDPVARFHLGNGAMVHRVHARADLSDKGRAQSGGAMVNYLYDLDAVLQNHERFAAQQDVVAAPEVEALVAKPPRNAA